MCLFETIVSKAWPSSSVFFNNKYYFSWDQYRVDIENFLPVRICIKQRTTSLFVFMNQQLCYSRQNKNFSIRYVLLEMKIKINKSKTKVLVCTKKEQTRQECIKLDQENLEGVKEFRNLGSKITWDGRNQKEIKSRIAQAKMGFNSKQKQLCFSLISL